MNKLLINLKKHVQTSILSVTQIDYAILVCFILFYCITILILKIPTDIQKHAHLIETIEKIGKPNPVFMYFFLVKALALFSSTSSHLLFSSAILLSISNWAKYMVTKIILQHSGSLIPLKNRTLYKNKCWMYSLMLTLCFSLPVATTHYLFGQFPPNLWHNSTTILLMPFSILLFYASLSYLRNPSNKTLAQTCILSLINLTIKPSFMFCFVIIFPIALLIQKKPLKYYIKGSLPVILSCIYIIVSHYEISTHYIGVKSNWVQIKPFYVWTYFSKNIPLSILASTLFPLTYILTHIKRLKKDTELLYSLSYLIVGLVIAILLTESGDRSFHGNFTWQVNISNYMVFLVCLKRILIPKYSAKINHENIIKKKKGFTLSLCYLAFYIHVISGLCYLLKFVLTKSFH